MTLPEVFEMLARYGPGGIFVILWWFERSERRDAQKELAHVSRDTIAALGELKGLVAQLSDIFIAQRRQR